MSAIALLFTVIFFGRNVADYNRVGDDRRREQAIHGADAAVDHALFWINQNKNWTTGDGAPPVQAAAATEEERRQQVRAERAWAMAQAADNEAIRSPEGEWAVVKPAPLDSNCDNPAADRCVIYGVGYIPTRAAPRRVRVIRTDYKFALFTPKFAVLTGGDLLINGNPTIQGSSGSAHANGNVSIVGNDPYIEQHATASQGYSAPCADSSEPDCIGDDENSGGDKPLELVPLINPREHYPRSQFDLCPDGRVHAGPSYSAGDVPPNDTGEPCLGPVVWDFPGDEFQGWKQSPVGSPDWVYTSQAAFHGVYYVYQGNARVSSSPGSTDDPWRGTIITEPEPPAGPEPGHCPHVEGDIVVTGSPKMRTNELAHPLLFVAGRDLQVGGNPGTRYEGALAAHEQAAVQGNPQIDGVVISNAGCDTPGSPVTTSGIELGGNPVITYNGGLEVPFGRTLTVTRWLEL